MALKLLPLELQDFDSITNHPSLYPPGDDLVGPPTPLCWPVTSASEALSRTSFHFAHQRARFQGDFTVRYMKVLDASTNEILSIARWHFYPHGYDFDSQIHWETHSAAPPVLSETGLPPPFNLELHNHILTTRDRARKDWIPVGEACWHLMHMVTRPSQRGKGAAGLLIKWGVEQAERDGVPAYLEAGVMGMPIYVKYGFEQVGELLEVDLKGHGVDTVFVMAKMGYFPNKVHE